MPAHGPIGGVEEVSELRNYLEACIRAKGDLSALEQGPWNEWANPQFTPINIERAHLLAQGDPSPPPSMLAMLGLD